MSTLYGDNIFNESGAHKILNYTTAIVNTKGQINSSITAIKKKLDSIDSKEEKKSYLDKQKAASKRGMSWRQNQAKTQIKKDQIKKEYQRLFDFLDSELEKL